MFLGKRPDNLRPRFPAKMFLFVWFVFFDVQFLTAHYLVIAEIGEAILRVWFKGH